MQVINSDHVTFLYRCRRARIAAVAGARVRRGQTRAAAEQFFAQGPLAVLLLKDAALLQLRHQQLDDIAEGFVSDGIGEVKAIDVRLFDPGLQFVRHGLRAANHQRTEAADPRPIGQGLHRPLAVRISGRKGLHRRLNGVGVQILQHLIRLILAEIDPRPAGEQRQRAFIADVLLIFLPLRLCLAVGVADNHRLQVEDQDAVRIAPASAARRRISATVFFSSTFDGAATKTHSAWPAANCLPRLDAPA